MGDYRQAYERSVQHPDEFWRAAAAAIDRTRPPLRVLDDSAAPTYRWFPDAECAVIGVHDPVKDQVLRGLVLLKSGVATDPAVLDALRPVLHDRVL